MVKRFREKLWVKPLIDHFDQQRLKVFSRSDLGGILQNEQATLGIPASVTLSRLVQVLSDEGKLREIGLRREERKTAVGAKKRYLWGEASDYAIGLSLARGGYLTHASALFLHALTEQVPKTIYVNKEQTPKPVARGALSQPAIDRAFKNAPRISKYVFVSDTARFVLLSGKNTGGLEVSEIQGPGGEWLRATKLERTLIDIVVRPTYAGGVFEVLAAYKAAAGRLSVNTLVATLRTLGYVYPYHQAIGFLLERAGFDGTQLTKLADLGIQWNFYLDYRMQDTAYNPRWRLYHPKGL